jgi:hypothetical protein
MTSVNYSNRHLKILKTEQDNNMKRILYVAGILLSLQASAQTPQLPTPNPNPNAFTYNSMAEAKSQKHELGSKFTVYENGTPAAFTVVDTTQGFHPDGGVVVYAYGTVAFLRDISQAQYFSAKWYGVKGDSSYEQAALQAFIDAVPDSSTLFFPKGTYVFDSVKIVSRKNLKLTGNDAVFKGQLIVGSTSDATGGSYEYNLLVEGIKFFEEDSTVNAIVLANANNVKINRVVFKGGNANVYVYPVSRSTHTSRITISNCTVEQNLNKPVLFRSPHYFFYCDNKFKDSTNYKGVTFKCADVTITGNNQIYSSISNVVAYGCDGMVCTNNTFFMTASFYMSQVKEQNIKIVTCNWVKIGDNNIFEAGAEGILLYKSANSSITGNNIAWPGQKDVSRGYGIHIAGGSYPDTNYCSNIVANNVINLPSRGGIMVDSTCNEVLVSTNTVKSPGNRNFYYGNGATSARDATVVPDIHTYPHYSVDMSGYSIGSVVVNTICKEVNVNIPVVEGMYELTKPRGYNNLQPSSTDHLRAININTSDNNTIDVQGAQLCFLNINSGGQIDSVKGSLIGEVLTIYNSSTPVTIMNNNRMQLYRNANTVLPFRGSITLQRRAGSWYEMARTYHDTLLVTGDATVNGQVIAHKNIQLDNNNSLLSKTTTDTSFSLIKTSTSNDIIIGSGNGNAYKKVRIFAGTLARQFIIDSTGGVLIDRDSATYLPDYTNTLRVRGRVRIDNVLTADKLIEYGNYTPAIYDNNSVVAKFYIDSVDSKKIDSVGKIGDSVFAYRKNIRSFMFLDPVTTGAGSTNANIGSGYRWAVPTTNNIKTLFTSNSLTVDSTTNTNALTLSFNLANANTWTGAPTWNTVTNYGGNLLPTTDNTYQLGTSTQQWSRVCSPIITSNTGLILSANNSSNINFNTTGSTRMMLFSSGSVKIQPASGTFTEAASAAFDVNSTTKGMLPPRMTTTQRDAIASPAEGLMLYNLTSHAMEFYNGSVWKTITTN